MSDVLWHMANYTRWGRGSWGQQLCCVLGASRNCSRGNPAARNLSGSQSVPPASQAPALHGVYCCHMCHPTFFSWGGVTPVFPVLHPEAANYTGLRSHIPARPCSSGHINQIKTSKEEPVLIIHHVQSLSVCANSDSCGMSTRSNTENNPCCCCCWP